MKTGKFSETSVGLCPVATIPARDFQTMDTATLEWVLNCHQTMEPTYREVFGLSSVY